MNQASNTDTNWMAGWQIAFVAIITSLFLAGCDRGRVERLEAETVLLQSELAKVQEEVKKLAEKQAKEAVLREQENVKQKLEAAEREQAELKRRQEQIDRDEKAKRELSANKVQAIEEQFDKIELRMKALLNTPINFAGQNPAERVQTQTQLKTVANAKREEIGEIIIRLKALGFEAPAELDSTVNSLVRDFDRMVFSYRLELDYREIFAAAKAEEARDQAEKSLSRAYEAIKAIQKMKADSALKISSTAKE